MSMLLKILAAVDLVSAFIIISKDYHFLGISLIFVLVLFGKGVTSLFADWFSRVYGAVDIIAGFMILLSAAFFPLDVIVFLIMVYKGLISLV